MHRPVAVLFRAQVRLVPVQGLWWHWAPLDAEGVLMAGLRECQHPKVKHGHGTLAAYQRDGCRCFPCRLANSQAYAAGRKGDGVFVSSVGVQRRLQALAVQGWGSMRIAARIGVSSRAVDCWRSGRYPQVRPETVLKVAAVYDELWDRSRLGRWSLVRRVCLMLVAR